jgi:hypothetical protein
MVSQVTMATFSAILMILIHYFISIYSEINITFILFFSSPVNWQFWIRDILRMISFWFCSCSVNWHGAIQSILMYMFCSCHLRSIRRLIVILSVSLIRLLSSPIYFIYWIWNRGIFLMIICFLNLTPICHLSSRLSQPFVNSSFSQSSPLSHSL